MGPRRTTNSRCRREIACRDLAVCARAAPSPSRAGAPPTPPTCTSVGPSADLLPWQVAVDGVKKRTDLKRIMIIGAGPIVIGQACEFDYSGTQACKALK